jgi:hypothetical protein
MADSIKVARCKGCPFFTQPEHDVYGYCSILPAEKVGEGQYRSYDIRDTSVKYPQCPLRAGPVTVEAVGD